MTAHRLRNGGIERSEYDGRGLLIRKLDPLGNATSYGYDATDRLALGQTTAMGYDAGGNLVSMTDAKGNTYSCSYDLLNRRTGLVYRKRYAKRHYSAGIQRSRMGACRTMVLSC